MVHNRHAKELDVLHGLHSFPATATPAGEAPLAIAPVTSFTAFHDLAPHSPLLRAHRPLKAEIAGPIPRVLPEQSVCEVFANRPDGSESNGYRVLTPLQF